MSITIKTDGLDQIKLTSSKSTLTKEDLVRRIQARVNPTDKDKESGIKPYLIENLVLPSGDTVQGMMIRYGSIRMGFVQKEDKDQDNLEFRKLVAQKVPKLGNKLWEQRKSFSVINKKNAGKKNGA